MEKVTEVWKNLGDIIGQENYSISNRGRILTESTGNIRTGYATNGYVYIDIKGKMYQVHRLVAMAFVPNPDNLPEINHKDENKSNNCDWNLEWCTHEYNINYGTRNNRQSDSMKGRYIGKNNPNYGNHKLTGENNPMYGRSGKLCPKSKAVLQFDLNHNFIAEYESVRQAANYGTGDKYISRCCKGLRASYNGFIWEYKQVSVEDK